MTAPVGTPAGAPAGSRPVRGEAALGIVLIVIGLAIAATWWVPDAGAYVPLAVGLGLLAMFVMTRNYGFAVPAGIVTGVGAGVAITATTDAPGGVFLLCLAAGFASVWVLGTFATPPQHSAWPLIPGAIIATVGLVSITDTVIDPSIAQGIIAGALIILGLAIILRRGSTARA